MSTHSRALLASLFFALSATVCALDDGKDDDGDYQIPEGYEERRYPLPNLTMRPKNFNVGYPGFQASDMRTLSNQNIMEILRYCVAPDTWSRRGSARMEAPDRTLVIIQKKEVFPEIEKVLKWLEDSVAPPSRVTLVAAALKLETVRKLTGGSIPAADFAKLLDETGEGGVELLDLRGVEGQQVASSAEHQQGYIVDYDVSGAVFDPVMRAHNSGFSANAVVYRNPDCATLQVDLSARISYPASFTKAKLVVENALINGSARSTSDTSKDDKGKETTTVTKVVHPEKSAIEIRAELNTDLPEWTSGGMQTSLSAAPGQFTLAGTIDLSASGAAPGKIVAVFVRASAGDGKIPTLGEVSGLKEGESFRLYPLTASQRALPSFTGKSFVDANANVIPGDRSQDFGISEPGGGAANPFGQPPVVTMAMSEARGLKDAIGKTQKIFAEKVRKNKLIEEMGPVVFTRLLEADHARFLKTMSDESRMYFAPMSVQMLALAIPPAAQRKLMLEDHATFEAAEVEALAANGAQILADSTLRMLSGQNSNVYAGTQRNYISDYEISGDSYDPVVRSAFGPSFAADFTWFRGALPGGDGLEVRFNASPAKPLFERATIDAFSVMNGADTNALIGVHADIDKLKRNVLNMRALAKGPMGKFTLAGSARMPNTPDGKSDPRQAVLFVRVSDEK